MRSVALAAEPTCAVGLHLHAQHLRIGLRHEVHRVQALLGGQARPTLEVERAVSRIPFRPHEQVGERRVRFVGAALGQRHLEGRHQIEFDHMATEVAQLDLAQLDVVFRAHPHRAMRVQVGPLRIQAHTVDVEGG